MANDLIDLIKMRRSVRSYTAEPVPEELLDQVLRGGPPSRPPAAAIGLR